MANVSGDKRSTFSRRVREILLPKPKELPILSASTPPPSRLPVRQKRSYREVDTQDALDLSHRSAVATSRGARVRPRTDSSSSTATVMPASKSLELTRTASRDTIDTIISPSSTVATKKHKRALSAIQFNPGPAGPAKTALTRSTSHNRVHVDLKEPGSLPKQAGIPFPTLKRASSVFSSKVFSKSGATAEQRLEAAETKTKATKPLQRESSSMMSIEGEGRDTLSLDLGISGSATDRALRRSTSSMMSVVSTEDARSSSPFNFPDSSRPDDVSETSPAPSDEQDHIQAALDRILEREMDDEDVGSDFRTLLSSVTRSPSTSSKNSKSSRSSARSFAAACSEDFSLAQNWTKGRFDVQIEPYEKHLTLWDAANTDIMAWCGSLIVVDTTASPTVTAPQYDYPPIEELQIEFSAIDDTLTLTPPPSPSSCDVRPFAPRSPRPGFCTSYKGKVLERKQISERVNPADGICLEPAWQWGRSRPLQASGDHADAVPSQVKPFYMLRFYIPLPVSLFERCEYRRFRMRTRIVFGAKQAGFPPLTEQSSAVDVSVEHLRKEIHMDGRKPLLMTPPHSSP